MHQRENQSDFLNLKFQKKETVEKQKNRKLGFEQNLSSKLAKSFLKMRHDSIRLIKWIAYGNG